MAELDDQQLLAEFTRTHSETAFAALVERHVSLVYSVALRGVGNEHAAQEISQAVFLILAHKANKISRKVVLSGWLYQTTRLTAANFLRGEIRRQQRESEAYMQSILKETEADAWPQIAPLLDDALGKLGERDRNAIVLRFFENKNLREVGAALGASEDAAKMRVNRALEKLRKIFGKCGVSLTTAIIAGAVSANSVHAAPVGLAMTLTAAAAKGAAVSGSTLTLIKGALKIMAWTKMKMAVVVGVGVLLTAVTATVVTKTVFSRFHSTSADAIFEEIWAHPDGDSSTALEKAPEALKLRPTHFPKMGQGIYSTSGKCVWVNGNIPFLVGLAYDQVETRMILPDGISGEGFDYINTLPDATRKIAIKDELKRRFGLVAHADTREVDVLLLKVKESSKLQSHLTKGGRFEDYGTGNGNIQKRIHKNVALNAITGEAEAFFRKPTLDRTGTKQHYDFDIQWMERKWSSAAERLAAVQSALSNQLDQLGLELVPSREPVEMLVVEKVK